MIPFHKIYLRLFSSLDFDVEKKLLHELKDQGVSEFLAIKRSWIYALKLSLVALIGVILMFVNSWLGISYGESIFAQLVLPTSYVIVGLLLLFDTLWYIRSYRATHKECFIQTNIDAQIIKNDVVNKNFISFFNISVTVSALLILIFIETCIFLIFFYDGSATFVFWLSAFINLFTGFCIFKHRRLSMNLELDFGLAVPGKVYIIDQTGLLSSKQSIVAINIKTVEGVYGSLLGSVLGYGDVKFFLEGNIPGQKGIIVLDYISKPRTTVDLLNKILS